MWFSEFIYIPSINRLPRYFHGKLSLFPPANNGHTAKCKRSLGWQITSVIMQLRHRFYIRLKNYNYQYITKLAHSLNACEDFKVFINYEKMRVVRLCLTFRIIYFWILNWLYQRWILNWLILNSYKIKVVPSVAKYISALRERMRELIL